MPMNDCPQIGEQLRSKNILVLPGVYDSLSALMAEQAGFQTAYLSGAAIAYTRFGRPDIGLIGMTEVAETIAVINERAAVRLVVDGDTGFGNALNVMRTVRRFEAAGAAAIQLEDQSQPKRCGHLSGKTLVPAGEMVGKIMAAVDARHSEQMLIVARTDGIAVEGFEAALDRADRYAEAGADILFVEAPQSTEQMVEIVKRFGGRIPLLANMVEGGKTPQKDAQSLEDLGFSLVIFPGGLVRAFVPMAENYMSSLKKHGSTQPFQNQMHDFENLNKRLGTNEMLQLGAQYDARKFEVTND